MTRTRSLHSSKSPFLPRSLTPSHKFSLFPSPFLPSLLSSYVNSTHSYTVAHSGRFYCPAAATVARRSVRPRPSTPQITTPAAMALIFPPHSFWPRNTWWLRSSLFATEFPHRVSSRATSLDLESRSREGVGCSLSSPRPPYFNPNERFVG